jgi:hypothetical protein
MVAIIMIPDVRSAKWYEVNSFPELASGRNIGAVDHFDPPPLVFFRALRVSA